MIKRNIIIGLMLLFSTVLCYIYIKSSDKEEKHIYNIKTVVFYDNENNLIPISVDLINHDSLMNNIYNKIEIMKSNDFMDKGLYPVFNSLFQVISLDIDEKRIGMHLYSGDDSVINMRMIESIAYILNDIIEVNDIDIVFHAENNIDSKVTYMVNNINKKLGINNFVDTSAQIHNSISVTAYRDVIIEGTNYYMPVTYRIDEEKTIYEKVQFILNEIDKRIVLKDAYIDNNILNIDLYNNVLNDNEKISINMEKKIILSLMSLSEYKNININIDGENVRNLRDSNISFNYFHFL